MFLFYYLLLQIVSKILKEVFVYGNLMDTSHILGKLLQRPEARYLTSFTMTATIENSVSEAIVSNIKNYLGTMMKTKGTRKTLEQQTYRTVLAACSGENFAAGKLLSKAAAALGVHLRNINRGVTDRTALEEAKGSGFVECSRSRYRNKMPDLVWAILDEFLHSDMASRPDNYRKRRYILTLPPDPVTGEVEYCVHFARELRGNWKKLWVILTGKDLDNVPVEGLEPTKYWVRIVRITTTPERPNGIIGSPKMLSKICCRCFQCATISQCSCPHCTHFCENLDHRHLAVIQGWRKAPVSLIVPECGDAESVPVTSTECRECGGDCVDPNGVWKK